MLNALRWKEILGMRPFRSFSFHIHSQEGNSNIVSSKNATMMPANPEAQNRSDSSRARQSRHKIRSNECSRLIPTSRASPNLDHIRIPLQSTALIANRVNFNEDRDVFAIELTEKLSMKLWDVCRLMSRGFTRPMVFRSLSDPVTTKTAV